MPVKVCKFGGSSLADAGQITKVRAIIQDDGQRRFIVPSAPGKRHGDDHKVTDLLYLCHEHARQQLAFDDVFALIAERYRQIAADLDVKQNLEPHLEQVRHQIEAHARQDKPADYAASRGEYMNALIIAEALQYPFIDAAELIFFDKRGRLDERKTYAMVSQRLADVPHAVIPGFYGTDIHGQVKTFSRGGSDVSGAIIARGVRASVYENWTDVSGLLMADPRIVDHPQTIATLTYRELRELSYMGATVLHDEAVFPVRHAGIPLHIRNTNDPSAPGTRIIRGDTSNAIEHGTISGIAGKRDFTVIAIEKAMMNAEIGFGRRVLNILEIAGINFEHMPSSIDTLSIVVEDSELNDRLDQVLEQIREECRPDGLEVFPNMALIATVGRGMARTPGMAARLFGSLAEAQVNIRMIDQGSSELNIIVGIEADDFEKAVRAIYHAFAQ